MYQGITVPRDRDRRSQSAPAARWGGARRPVTASPSRLTRAPDALDIAAANATAIVRDSATSARMRRWAWRRAASVDRRQRPHRRLLRSQGFDVRSSLTPRNRPCRLFEPGYEQTARPARTALRCAGAVRGRASDRRRRRASLALPHFIAEEANGPTTPGADRVLAERNEQDLRHPRHSLQRRRGSLSAISRWVQDLQQYFWSKEEVMRPSEQTLDRSWAMVDARARRDGISGRMAAMAIGVERVVKTKQMRGLFP